MELKRDTRFASSEASKIFRRREISNRRHKLALDQPSALNAKFGWLAPPAYIPHLCRSGHQERTADGWEHNFHTDGYPSDVR